jgi:transcriptional regulator with XRE-family HTH domain
MSIKNIKERLKSTSKKDTNWIENAKYRKANEAWLDISFAIAVKIMSVLKQNKIDNKFPKNQKELAEALNCSPQNVNNLLSGTENFKLETITKIEQILNISLIQVPRFEFEATIQIKQDKYKFQSEPIKKIELETTIANYDDFIDLYENKTESPNNLTKLIA